MSTKIDLDELERKSSRLVAAAKRVADRPNGETSPCDAVSDLGMARHEFDFAATAPVTLALVERVRRLEGQLSDVRDALRSDPRGWPATIATIDALLERGAVLP